MYLSHFAVIHVLHQLWPLADGVVSLLIAAALTALISYLVSIATYRLIERPAQALAKHLTSEERVSATLAFERA